MIRALAVLLLLAGCAPFEERNECWETSAPNTGATIWYCVGSEASAACSADQTKCEDYAR